MLFGWMKNAVGHPHALFASWPPEVAARMEGVGPNLIPYCAFEGTKVSDYTRDLCNGSAFCQVWVVSDFVRDALIAGGVEPERVVTVRPPMCDGPWKEMLQPLTPDVPRASGTVPPKPRPFTFGVMGTWQKRKGMHDLVRAYFSAFSRDDDVQLIIRTSAFAGNLTIREFKEKLTEEIAAIAAELGDDNFPASKKQPKLRFELGTGATDAEVVEWLGSAIDCYVNPSYGEGLGIPHIWAKAHGIPMVSSGYGAVGAMLREIDAHVPGESIDVAFPYELTPVDPEILQIALMFERDTQWGTYKPEDLGQAMRTAFERGAVVDREVARMMRHAFSMDACLPPMKKALDQILSGRWALP
jgi:glycosyltransferase involved in cell wall biosynthesis